MVWQSIFTCALLLFLNNAQVFAKEAPFVPPSVDQSGQKVFAKVLPFAYKVKTSPSADSPQASYGTGFVVDREGLLISNYHVVADSIIEPKKNKIFVIIDDQPIAGKVLAIDVVHDLSLIRIDKTFPRALPFAAAPPQQGTPIYSIGQPEDLNMSIVAGTYNNEIDFGKYTIIHMSSPINSGMSGGPTVNQNGEVIGVNVSKLVRASNLSFSVPARFAQALYQKNKSLKEHADVFWPDMEKQLMEVQESLTQEILKNAAAKKSFHQWNVPQLSKALKCWSVEDKNSREEKENFDVSTEICDLDHEAYLAENAYSGAYKIAVMDFENKKLNSWQFFELLTTTGKFMVFNENPIKSMDQKPKLTTTGACTSEVVINKVGTRFKIGYCARAYTYFPLIQDVFLSLRTIEGPPNALAVDLDLRGFTPENTKKIAQKFVEEISRSQP